MSKLDEAMNNMLVSLGRIGADVKVAAAYRQGGEDAARALLEWAKEHQEYRIVAKYKSNSEIEEVKTLNYVLIDKLEEFFK